MKRNQLQGQDTETIMFEALGQSFGYRFPQPDGVIDGRMNNIVQTVIQAVGALDDAAHKAHKDAHLSPAGKAQQVQPKREAAMVAIKDAEVRIGGEKLRIEAARTKLYAVPQLEPTDAVGATLDAEIRARTGALEQAQRMELFAGYQQGENERVVLALMRDPFANSVTEIARTLWKERVDKANPTTVRTLASDAENVEWAASAVAALRDILARTNDGVFVQAA